MEDAITMAIGETSKSKAAAIGARLRARRIAMGLDEATAASIAEITQAGLDEVEAGGARLADTVALALALGIEDPFVEITTPPHATIDDVLRANADFRKRKDRSMTGLRAPA